MLWHRWQTFIREYLREFSKKLEMILMRYSEARGIWFMKKTWSRKSRVRLPLKISEMAFSILSELPAFFRPRQVNFFNPLVPTALIPVQFSWNLHHMLILVVGEHSHWNVWKILKNKKVFFPGCLLTSRTVHSVPPGHSITSRNLQHATCNISCSSCNWSCSYFCLSCLSYNLSCSSCNWSCFSFSQSCS